MKATDSAARLLVSFGIFFAVVIIVSNIIGFFWLNSFFVAAISAVITYFLMKLFGPKPEASKGVFLLLILLLILLAAPLILLTNMYPSSTDAISTTMLRILDGSIPLTHTPYTNINLSYALGSPLVNNMFSEIFFVVPDFMWPWIMGLVCGVLQLFFFYLFSKELLRDKKAAIYAAVIFFCGKLIFENFYVGEFGWYLGSTFMILFLYLHVKKNPLQYVIFPVTFVAHPLAGFNLLLILCAEYIAKLPKLVEVGKLVASLFLVAPLILMSYLPIAVNLLFNQTDAIESTSTGALAAFLAAPFWVGTGLTIIFVASLVVAAYKKNLFKFEQKRFVWGMFFISVVAFIVFNLLGFMLAGRVIEITIISMTLLSAIFISQLKLDKVKKVVIILLILILAMTFFFTSGKLDHYRDGSKITPNAIDFARSFYYIDPEMSTVLFLANEGGKMAEYSNKIPYDVTNSHTIVFFDFVYYHDAAFKELKEKKAIQTNIFVDGNISRIADLNVKYIVVDTQDFNGSIPYPLLLDHGNYKLYSK